MPLNDDLITHTALYLSLHLFGAICLVPWILRSNPKYRAALSEAGQNPVWWLVANFDPLLLSILRPFLIHVQGVLLGPNHDQQPWIYPHTNLDGSVSGCRVSGIDNDFVGLRGKHSLSMPPTPRHLDHVQDGAQ